MNFYITQTITIQKLSIGTINNSSVVQIGTAGAIEPLTNLYNTGNFVGPAPQLDEYNYESAKATPASPTTPSAPTAPSASSPEAPSLVPLSPQ